MTTIRRQRNDLFVNMVKQGSPCMKLKPDLDKLLKYLSISKNVYDDL
jgi:hypothetical protein